MTVMSKHRGLVRAFARGKMPIALIAALLPFAGMASAEDKEPSAVVELGGAGSWDLPHGTAGFGPTAAVEFTAIKDWLEIEAGVAPLFSPGRTDWDIDFVFKKPFELSPTIEFEPGIGPEWTHTVGGAGTTDALAVEVIADFMFWSSPDRKFGWFLQPSYSYSFGREHEQSLGVNVGLLIPIR